MNVCFDLTCRLPQLSISYLAVRRLQYLRIVLNFYRIYLDGILNLKKGYDKTFKTIPTVSEDLLKIAWKCMKIALII